MKDPRLSSSDAAKELETAAAALEARIRDADETRESLTNGDDEYGYVHSRPLGTGLVSCGSCGRTLAAEALVSHRKENCAGARRALGAEGVARALGGVWGAVDVPQAPAAAVIPAASPPKPAKKMTKKALKEQRRRRRRRRAWAWARARASPPEPNRCKRCKGWAAR